MNIYLVIDLASLTTARVSYFPKVGGLLLLFPVSGASKTELNDMSSDIESSIKHQTIHVILHVGK